MKFTKYLYCGIVASSLSFFGCSSDFVEGYSVDKSGLQEVNVNNLLTNAQQQSAWAQGDELARITEVTIQRAIGTGRQAAAYNRYALTEGNAGTDWGTNLYAGAMMDLNTIINEGQSQGANHYVGVAKVLMAVNLGYLTDLFGDIPYTEAFMQADNLSPKYDSQESIYLEIQKLCSEAIVSLNKPGVSTLNLTTFDQMYKGDTDKWVMLAHAVKARHLNHLSKLPGYDASSVLSEVSKSFKANADNAYVSYEDVSTKGNPWAQFNIDRTDLDYVTGTVFDTMLSSNNDPRKAEYIAMSDISTGFFGGYNSKMVLYTYHEMKFIEAEAIFRTSGASAALQPLKDGIQANMEMLGVASDEITAYLAALPLTVSLELIMNEKYRALFTQSESWTDWRRTGFPNLNFNPTNGSTDITEIARRIPYPQSERLYNKNFIDLGSSENRTKRMWWDK